MLEMLDFLNKICNNNLSSVSAVSQNSSLLAFESCVLCVWEKSSAKIAPTIFINALDFFVFCDKNKYRTYVLICQWEYFPNCKQVHFKGLVILSKV